MAAMAGIDLERVEAGAPDGGIRKPDIEKLLEARHAGSRREAVHPATGGAHETTPPAEATSPYEDRPLSAARRVTAARLLQAKQSVPHFYLRTGCRVDALAEIRARMKCAAVEVKPTITDFVVKAAAVALKRVQVANSSWTGDAIRVYGRPDISVAVNTPAGLLTPIVRGADAKPLSEISRELADLVRRARAGRLQPSEYSGGTFTISNLGMYGVESLYAIVNPPQSCILGIGSVEERPVVQEGRLSVGTMMTCTLSADHRAIDGATGAEFLAAFKSLMEEPWLLML
jgi:pyruvate dehydrogenase E2 component (dihydrolipoamide acetyltransferase)